MSQKEKEKRPSKEASSGSEPEEGDDELEFKPKKKIKKEESKSKKITLPKDSTEGSKEEVKVQPNKKAGITVKEGEITFDLTAKKKIAVSKFKGKKTINIREQWEKDGMLLPTKKGVTLTEESWKQLKEYIPDIDEALDNL